MRAPRAPPLIGAPDSASPPLTGAARHGFLTGKRATCAFPCRSSNAIIPAIAVLIISARFIAPSLLVHPGPRHKSDLCSTLPLYTINSSLPFDDDTVDASRSTIPQTLWDQRGCKCLPRVCPCDAQQLRWPSCPLLSPPSSTWRPAQGVPPTRLWFFAERSQGLHPMSRSLSPMLLQVLPLVELCHW